MQEASCTHCTHCTQWCCSIMFRSTCRQWCKVRNNAQKCCKTDDPLTSCRGCLVRPLTPSVYELWAPAAIQHLLVSHIQTDLTNMNLKEQVLLSLDVQICCWVLSSLCFDFSVSFKHHAPNNLTPFAWDTHILNAVTEHMWYSHC